MDPQGRVDREVSANRSTSPTSHVHSGGSGQVPPMRRQGSRKLAGESLDDKDILAMTNPVVHCLKKKISSSCLLTKEGPEADVRISSISLAAAFAVPIMAVTTIVIFKVSFERLMDIREPDARSLQSGMFLMAIAFDVASFIWCNRSMMITNISSGVQRDISYLLRDSMKQENVLHVILIASNCISFFGSALGSPEATVIARCFANPLPLVAINAFSPLPKSPLWPIAVYSSAALAVVLLPSLSTTHSLLLAATSLFVALSSVLLAPCDLPSGAKLLIVTASLTCAICGPLTSLQHVLLPLVSAHSSSSPPLGLAATFPYRNMVLLSDTAIFALEVYGRCTISTYLLYRYVSTTFASMSKGVSSLPAHSLAPWLEKAIEHLRNVGVEMDAVEGESTANAGLEKVLMEMESILKVARDSDIKAQELLDARNNFPNISLPFNPLSPRRRNKPSLKSASGSFTLPKAPLQWGESLPSLQEGVGFHGARSTWSQHDLPAPDVCSRRRMSWVGVTDEDRGVLTFGNPRRAKGSLRRASLQSLNEQKVHEGGMRVQDGVDAAELPGFSRLRQKQPPVQENSSWLNTKGWSSMGSSLSSLLSFGSEGKASGTHRSQELDSDHEDVTTDEETDDESMLFRSHSEIYGGIVEVMSVDDDHTNQLMIEGLLVPHGYVVTPVMGGEEALELLESRDFLPDVILLDCQMPHRSGYDICADLRRLYPETLPVIMISSNMEETNILMGFEVGANDYVKKPFNRAEVLARIETQLRLKTLWTSQVDHARSAKLLNKMLPPHIMAQLKAGSNMIAESHDEVTILFSDIVGFTTLAAKHSTAEIIITLNQMFTLFDALVDKHGVYKVQTIGDAYMIAAGHDSLSRADHLQRVFAFAKDTLEEVTKVKMPAGASDLQVRIGIHTGPAYAGVVGVKCPRYCFFGDTVNTASRMESNGYPMCIHVSKATRDLMGDDCEWVDCGASEIKGKGMMQTFFAKLGPWEDAIRARQPSSLLSHDVTCVSAPGARDASTNGDASSSLGSLTAVSSFRTNPKVTGLRAWVVGILMQQGGSQVRGGRGEVGHLLRHLGMHHYLTGLEKEEVFTLGMLADMDDKDLIECGVSNVASRRRILEAARSLQYVLDMMLQSSPPALIQASVKAGGPPLTNAVTDISPPVPVDVSSAVASTGGVETSK